MPPATTDRDPSRDPDETIRRTVRALRSAYDVDARDLARHLGISRNSLYNRLNGVAPWLAAEIVALADFFNCNIADFYTGNIHIDRSIPLPRRPSGEGDQSADRGVPFPLTTNVLEATTRHSWFERASSAAHTRTVIA